MYKIVISKQALKDLIRLPLKVNLQISKAIEALASNPRPQGCKKLKGEQEYVWRIRVGNYRVLYNIDDRIEIVDVRKIGHRKDIYQ
jgi:mRNA interferase RelE/StbE